MGVVAQGIARLPLKPDGQSREGICFPVSANYVARWIDSVRQNNFDILGAYRRKIFQVMNDPDIVDLFVQNKKLVVEKNNIFPETMGARETTLAQSYSLGTSMYRNRHGELKYQRYRPKILFGYAENFFRKPGAYYISLRTHGLAFVNYSHQEGGNWSRNTDL